MQPSSLRRNSVDMPLVRSVHIGELGILKINGARLEKDVNLPLGRKIAWKHDHSVNRLVLQVHADNVEAVVKPSRHGYHGAGFDDGGNRLIQREDDIVQAKQLLVDLL